MKGLIDSTLREGAQAPGPYLTPEQQSQIVEGLVAIGVEELELGHAVAERAYDGGPLRELIAAARDASALRASGPARSAVWCRARRDDIVAAARLRPQVVSFALPVSDLHLGLRLGKDRNWAVAELPRLVAAAREAGVPYVSVGFEDATRADRDFLIEIADAADAAGADRVRIADTVGAAQPGEVIALVTTVKTWFRGDIGVHLHNDFGMASGGALAALEAGAEWADVSVQGLGERAGISRLEEVAGWLVAKRDRDYDLIAARRLAEQVGAWTGRPVPRHAPVIGEGVFACESGLHLAGLVKSPETYEPFPPELVGARRDWRLGKGAGRAAVAAMASLTPAPGTGVPTESSSHAQTGARPGGAVPTEAADHAERVARIRAAATTMRRSLDPNEWSHVLTVAGSEYS